MKKLLLGMVMVVMLVMVVMAAWDSDPTIKTDYNKDMVSQFCKIKGYDLTSEVELTSDKEGQLWMEYICKCKYGHLHAKRTEYDYVKEVVENHKNVYLKLE